MHNTSTVLHNTGENCDSKTEYDLEKGKVSIQCSRNILGGRTKKHEILDVQGSLKIIQLTKRGGWERQHDPCMYMTCVFMLPVHVMACVFM